jgi:peptide/nickel transport system ATP-binding protein
MRGHQRPRAPRLYLLAVGRERPVTALLQVRDLHVSFAGAEGRRVNAVRGVDFDVHAGERLALVGESGCGKTTSVLGVMGLLPTGAQATGSIRIAGAETIGLSEQERRATRWRDVAMVFQGAMNSLNPVQQIGAQIAEPMVVHQGVERRAARRRAGALLELVGIAPARVSAFPHELSGGMRQRAAIAMALACDPKLLIADEPTTALDTMVQAQIFELLVRLTDELGIGLLLVTHDLPVVMHFCDRAGVMYAGRMIESGPVDRLYHRAAHPYTRRLFAASPDLRTRDSVQPIPGTPPRLDEPVAGCGFCDRCDCAIERCAEEDPSLVQVEQGHDHRAACWRAPAADTTEDER